MASMRDTFVVVLVALCTTSAVQAKLGLPGGPLKLHFDVPDSFKIISSWQSALSIADSDSDSMFDCLTANRTKIDFVSQTATFVWLLHETDHSPRQEVTFSVRPGPTPGTMEMTVGDDPTVLEGIFYYMDDNCLVMDLEYHGHQCLLWVRKEVKDLVPKECFERFSDACGEPLRERRRELCPDS